MVSYKPMLRGKTAMASGQQAWFKACFVFLAWTALSNALAAADSRTARLVDLARVPAPRAMDVDLILRYPPPPRRSEKEMVEAWSRVFDGMKKDQGEEAENAAARQKFIDVNSANELATASIERIAHKRIRYRGQRYREDRSYSTTGEPPPPECLFEQTVVNVGNPAQGDFTSFSYDHAIGRLKHIRNSARIENTKGGQYTVMPVWNLICLHEAAAFVITQATSDGDKTRGLVPSAKKSEALEDGTNPYLAVKWEESVVPGTSINADKCSIFPKATSNFKVTHSYPAAVIYLDPADYRRDWRVELYDPYGGKLLTVTDKRDFDETGLARRYAITEYKDNGNSERQVMEILSARAMREDEMDAGLFEFNPPEDYIRADFRQPGPARWMNSKGDVLNQEQINRINAAQRGLENQRWGWQAWLLVANVLVFAILSALQWLRRQKAA